MSQNICILPFISVDKNSDLPEHSYSPCCLYQPKSKSFYDVAEYWNSSEMQGVRKQMLKGERPAGCWKCYKEEDIGKISMRQSVNDGRLQSHSNALTIQPSKPLQIKLVSGASCNLACRMCESHISSRVNQVWKAIGRPTQSMYQYDDQTDNYIRQHASDLQYVELMGGEPFYHKKVIALLNFLVQQKHSDHITLFVVTNGMLLSQNIMDLLSSFQKVVVRVSIDGLGKVHEYIRPGSDWQTIITHMDNMRKFANIDVLVQPTVSVLNILRLPELDDWCGEEGFNIAHHCLVYNPEELNPKQLPLELREQVHNRYEKYLEPKTYPCLPFISQLDKHWQTNIKETMPEWNIDTKDNIELEYQLYEKIKNT